MSRQHYIRGVSAGFVFSPTALTGLLLYLPDGAAFNGTVWKDRSGLGNNYTVSVGSPDNATGINGQPTVHFTRADGDGLAGPAGMFSGVTAAEAFIVTKCTAATGNGLWTFGTGSASYYPFDDGHIYENFASTARPNAGAFPVTATDSHVYNARAGSDGSYALSFDGAAPFYTASGNTVDFADPSVLGRAGVGFGGDMGSVIIYNRVLTVDERTAVLRYLRTKWGTP